MQRRERWEAVLNAEFKRWSEKSCEDLRSELATPPAVYTVELDSVIHQVEVDLLEDTLAYVHVIISVDDGSLPQSVFPSTRDFIQKAN
jgi:hypothetical protein